MLLLYFQEYECSFKNCADRKLRLTETQEDLASMISSHDMSILQQRLQLLNKQWQELHHQVELRHERIECRLARWVALNEKYRELMDQMAQMDDKISSGKDYHVEDFLHKLENVRCLRLIFRYFLVFFSIILPAVVQDIFRHCI